MKELLIQEGFIPSNLASKQGETLLGFRSERKVREFAKSPAGKIIAAAVAFGSVNILISACGGGGEANNPTVTANPETATPVATAVKPTEKPTVVATASPNEVVTRENLPEKVDRVNDLIAKGFDESGSKINENTVPVADVREVDIVRVNLNQCNNNRQPVTPFQNSSVGTINPDNTLYGGYVNTVCIKVANATKQLFEVTRNQKFLEANQLFEHVHKYVFDSLAPDYPANQTFSSEHWTSIVDHYYTIK